MMMRYDKKLIGCVVCVAMFPCLSVLPVVEPEEEEEEEAEVEDLPVTFEAPTVFAKPGETIDVPIVVKNDVSLSLAAFSLEYAPAAANFDSTSLSEEVTGILARNPLADSSFVWHFDDVQGWLQAAIVLDYAARPEIALPPGATPVAVIKLAVRADALPGRHDLRFTRVEEAEYEGEFKDELANPVYNWARRDEEEIEDENEFERGDEPEYSDGAIVIGLIGDVNVFARGDANADYKINIADPSRILGYLFLGAEACACEDAADTNDDGKIDLSDAVGLLNHLFIDSGGNELITGASTADATPDGLGCGAY